MLLKEIVNWGIIGCGKHATKVMVPAFSDTTFCKLSALGSSNKLTRERLSRQLIDTKIFDSYQAVLDDQSIDAVYIGLPNSLHAPWCLNALNAGKHVLCDKPIAINAQEAIEIQECAKANQLLCTEGFMYRFHPQYETVENLLRVNALGQVKLLEGHFHYSLQDLSDIRWNSDLGGGVLLDIGCYILDAAQFILGEPIELLSASAVIHDSQKVDESLFAQLKTPSGIIISLTVSANMPRENSLKIYGADAILEIERAFIVPRNSQARLNLRNLNDKKPQRFTIPAANQYAIELDQFSKKILGQEVKENLFSTGISNLQVIDRIFERI